MRERCSEHLDIAIRHTFNTIDNEKGSVRILGNGFVHEVNARSMGSHIRSSRREVELDVIGDGTDADEVEIDEVESGNNPEEAVANGGRCARPYAPPLPQLVQTLRTWQRPRG